jgi:hypothetical protein
MLGYFKKGLSIISGYRFNMIELRKKPMLLMSSNSPNVIAGHEAIYIVTKPTHSLFHHSEARNKKSFTFVIQKYFLFNYP